MGLGGSAKRRLRARSSFWTEKYISRSEMTLRVQCDQDTWEERVGLGGSAKRQLRARSSLWIEKHISSGD